MPPTAADQQLMQYISGQGPRPAAYGPATTGQWAGKVVNPDGSVGAPAPGGPAGPGPVQESPFSVDLGTFLSGGQVPKPLNADPTSVMRMPTPPAAAAQQGASAPPAQPQSGYAAPTPAGYPAPLGSMPALYNAANLPTGQQMQQLPGGQYVASSQAPAAQHALGLDRLPDFNSYLAQHPAGADWANGGPMNQADVLKQYLGLSGAQNQADEVATNRMGTAGNLGVAQGQLGLQQSKQAYDQGQGITDAAKLAVLQGGMSNPNSTPESFSTGIQNVNRLFPQGGAAPSGPAGPPAPAAPGAPPPAGGLMMPGGQQGVSNNGLTGSQQLLGEGLANQLSSRPELKGASPREKFDYISSIKGPDWVKQNFPALQNYLSEGTPGAADQLRGSSRASMVEQALKSPFALLGAGVQAPGGPRASLWSQQGRQQFGQAMDTPFGEQLGNFLGQPATSSQNNSALLRSLMP